MYPAGSEGTPSAGTSNDGESRLPPGSSVPTERNDGKEDDTTPSDGQPDWGAEAEGGGDDEPLDGQVQDQPQGGEDDEPAPQPKPKPQPKPVERQAPQKKPAAQQQPKPGEEPGGEPAPEDQPGEGEQPAGEDQQPGEGQQPEVQETAEQKAAREAKEAEQRQKYEQELEDYYKLPDDLAARLATEPETVLPKLAAKVHQAVMVGVQNQVTQMIPEMFQRMQQVQKANQSAMDAFYGRWPGLRKHEKQVLEVGKMYRQMNPKATPQESVERIGMLVAAAMGFDPATLGKPQGNGQQPAARRRPGAPARPAGVGGSQAGNAPAPENPWAAEADAMLEDDRE